MKHPRITWLAMLLIVLILAGCGPADPTTPTTDIPAATNSPTELPAEAPTKDATVPANTQEDIAYAGEFSHYIDVVYAEQIGRYYTALAEKWNKEQCLDNGISEVLATYYVGNPLSNVGFGFADLDNDSHLELIIGAILDAETAPAVFEIWTLVDNQPTMVAQADTKSQYILQYSEEDYAWYVACEATNGASANGTYYLMINAGKLEVMQGIVFNTAANEETPWFMAYDLDWDVSNDEPIDADTANAILDSNRKHYTALELIPYTLYK